MFIEVIPKNSSFSVRPLTYVVGDAFREKIHIGCLVQIPLGKKEDVGIVVSLDSPGYSGDVRSILSIITENSILAPYQCELIKYIGNRYLMRSNKLFSLFLPAPLYRKLEMGGFQKKEQSIENPSEGREFKNKEFIYLVTKNGVIQKEHILNLLAPRTLVICPDDFMLYALEKEFGGKGDTAVFLPNESSDTKKARVWMEIKNGKYREIFGTRRLLYYNLEEYKQILYVEDAFGRKQYQYPTYINNLEILRFLQKNSHISIKILSSIPSLESMKLFSSEEITYI